MWILSNQSSEYWLCPIRQEYSIGRSGSNIILLDKSVSRRHAILQLERCNDHSRIFIQDCGSKSQTFVNGQAINEITELHNGDSIKIGLTDLKLVKKVFKFCVSSLSQKQFEAYQSNSGFCDYVISREWDNSVTHLVMPVRSPTQKALFALQSAIYIVSDEFLRSIVLIAAQLSNSNLSITDQYPQIKLPCELSFLPRIDNQALPQLKSCWFPNLARKTVFKGICFITADRSIFQNLEMIILNSQGQIRLICLDSLIDELKKVHGQYEKIFFIKNSCNYSQLQQNCDLIRLQCIDQSIIASCILKGYTDGVLPEFQKVRLPQAPDHCHNSKGINSNLSFTVANKKSAFDVQTHNSNQLNNLDKAFDISQRKDQIPKQVQKIGNKHKSQIDSQSSAIKNDPQSLNIMNNEYKEKDEYIEISGQGSSKMIVQFKPLINQHNINRKKFKKQKVSQVSITYNDNKKQSNQLDETHANIAVVSENMNNRIDQLKQPLQEADTNKQVDSFQEQENIQIKQQPKIIKRKKLSIANKFASGNDISQ